MHRTTAVLLTSLTAIVVLRESARSSSVTEPLRSPLEFQAPDTLDAGVPLVFDHFTLDTDGWNILARGGDPKGRREHPIVFPLRKGGGNGWISAGDPHYDQTMYWLAPAKYYGNQHRAFGRSLTYSLASTLASQPNLRARVILVGAPGDSLYYKNSSLSGPEASLLASPNFKTYTIPLVPGKWKTGNGVVVTVEHFCKVLRDLHGLLIQAEFTKEKEIDSLDEVSWGGGFSSIPTGGPRPPCN